jgi:hypothetical protein
VSALITGVEVIMKRIRQSGLICLLIIGFFICSTASIYGGVNPSLAPKIIPLTVEKGMPYLQVKIGAKVLRMTLDTGENRVFFAIKPSVLQELTVDYSTTVRKNLDAAGNVYNSKIFTLPFVQMGDLDLTNVTAFEELRDTPDCDGIIGNMVLESFIILIDYPNARLVLYPKTTYPAELDLAQWLKLSFVHENIGIICKGKLGPTAKELRFCLDTGAVCLNEKGKSYGLLKPQVATEMTPAGNDTETMLIDHFYLDGIDIGPMDFYLYNFAQPPVDGFLGYNFLVDHQVLIDFERQLLFIRAVKR